MTELGTLPGGNTTFAYDLNHRGQVVGYGDVAPGLWHAFLWENGELTDLGGFPGSMYTMAKDINALGQVVGYSDEAALLWEGGVMTELSTLGGGFSQAESINERGQIVGYSQTSAGHYHATLWTR